MYAKYKGDIFIAYNTEKNNEIVINTNLREKEILFNFKRYENENLFGLRINKNDVELIDSPEFNKFYLRYIVKYKNFFFRVSRVTRKKMKLIYSGMNVKEISKVYKFNYDWYNATANKWVLKSEVIPVDKMINLELALFMDTVCLIKKDIKENYILIPAEGLDKTNEPLAIVERNPAQYREKEIKKGWKKGPDGYYAIAPKSEVFVYSEAKEPLIV